MVWILNCVGLKRNLNMSAEVSLQGRLKMWCSIQSARFGWRIHFSTVMCCGSERHLVSKRAFWQVQLEYRKPHPCSQCQQHCGSVQANVRDLLLPVAFCLPSKSYIMFFSKSWLKNFFSPCKCMGIMLMTLAFCSDRKFTTVFQHFDRYVLNGGA